ncbi:flagellar associated protein [Ectocarpus siliculosus]|uniref:Flagellar associated protein n=1 Tax=Ectocarpus siliculosus TaxID=2880 RepID=D7G5A5_ECTSI|nr:flagellar associated protein [Ectocarpus siliculosus]|eukprot:CBJ27259.1 flagellar associated protein [Ectocarpus siliculosus]
MGMKQRKARLGQMAALCRLASKGTDQDIAELRGILDHIAAEKERDAGLFSPRASVACSRQAARTYGEFVCTLEGSASKGQGEVIMLTRDSDFGRISGFLQEAFNLTGGVLITLPEDRLFDEMEQLVLSTKHLQGLIDDFVLRQPPRRVLKVMKATFPITRCLVGGSHGDLDADEAIVVALNQLLELVQVPANLETVDRAGRLSELLVAVGSVIGHSSSSVQVAVACQVVWKLATSTDMRRRMLEHGLQNKLWALAESIARTVETPEHRKARQKAAAEAAAAAAGTAGGSTGVDGSRGGEGGPLLLQEVTGGNEDEAHTSGGEEGGGVAVVLEAGQEMDEVAAKCVGAISLMLRSQEAADSLSGSEGYHNGLEILLELATAGQRRGGIEDESVPCMAAEALAHVLISHGTCRLAWAEQGSFLSLLDLMRSPLSRVVLCCVSILNAFLRGEPSQIAVTPAEAIKVLEQASPACQRCLDQLESTMLPVDPKSTAAATASGTRALAGVCSPLHQSMDAETQDSMGILEQATAACWGSLAVIDRCPPGPGKKAVSSACWFRTMLSVAKLAGSKWLSPWVVFCAVACIGVGVGTGASVDTDSSEEVGNSISATSLYYVHESSPREEGEKRYIPTDFSRGVWNLDTSEAMMEALPGEMLALLKRTNSLELQEHAARTLCTLMSANENLRRKAFEDGFLDKLQRLLMRRLGSAQFDSTIACSIMYLCDIGAQSKSSDNSNTKTENGNNDNKTVSAKQENSIGDVVENAGLAEGSSKPKRQKRAKRSAKAAKEAKEADGALWSEKQLTSLVWALGHTNQDVLTYTAWTILDVKEGVLAAIWLLACDTDNTVRLAMNGGLQLLVGILNFPSSACYVPLKSLAVGTLCNMCHTEPDVATLAMHLSLASALLQACGSFLAASLSLGARSRSRLQDNGGVEALCRLVRATSTKEPLKVRSLHALLNFSTETGCQPSICRWALQPLVELTVSSAPPQSEFASSILCNCAENPCCRAIMFEGQISRGSKQVTASRADRSLEESIRASLWAGRLTNGGSPTARIVREQFLAWVQGVKGGDFSTPKERCAGADSDSDTGKSVTKVDGDADATRAHGREGQERVPEHERGAERKPTIPPIKTGHAAMVQVRQDFRQPVTSLWQTASERAATAPTRAASRGGGIVDSTNTATARRGPSHRRPQSQAGASRTHGMVTSAPPTGATTNARDQLGNARPQTGGRGAVSSAGEGRKSNSRGQALRESDLTSTPAISPSPVCVSGGREADGQKQRRRRTPIPLRSSHRVGPVGSLGSTPFPAGEYRWRPFVSDCYTKPNPLPAWRRKQHGTLPDSTDAAPSKGAGATQMPVSLEPTKEEREDMFNQAVKENQTVVVVEPPLNYKLVFDGPTRSGVAKPLVNPTSMALFPHVRGASVCAEIYDHYVAEDGLCYHLYHTSRVICEVLDPGGYPSLSEPTELRHVLHKALPEEPPPDYPSVVIRHVSNSLRVSSRKACPGTRCKMFGAMPSDFMVFEVSEQPQEEEDEDQSTSTLDASTKWDVNHSIFAPRRREAESRTFWDTERVVLKALDADFGRMLKEDRIVKLMAKSDNAVAKGQKSVAESLDEVKKAVAPFYKSILCIFKYYCLTPSQSVRGAFSIQPNQFGKMMQDTELAGNFISVEEIGKIFVMVNFESDKRSAEATVNEDRALMRFELLEALLRVAITVRDNEGQEELSPAEKMRNVIEEQLLVNLPPEALEDPDTFRNETLYTDACDGVLQEHQKALGIVYQKYSMLDPIAGKPSFGLEEWKTFTNDARLIGDNIHMLRMGLRDIKQPFYMARMMVSDEIKSRVKMTQLTFVDFLEALTRLAIAMPIPSDQDMREAEVTDIMDYESALSFSVETSAAQHDVVAGATGGLGFLVAPRLDRLIRFILGTLAIRSNGVLKAGNKGMNLVGLYCTKKHLARGILPP